MEGGSELELEVKDCVTAATVLVGDRSALVSPKLVSMSLYCASVFDYGHTIR